MTTRALSRLFVGALDVGTSSTRFIVFDKTGAVCASAQRETPTIREKGDWAECDPLLTISVCHECIEEALNSAAAKEAGVKKETICGIGITNHRESVLFWDRSTGKPLSNIILWHDMRTSEIVDALKSEHGENVLRQTCGLPLATYFSGLKMKWLLDNKPDVKTAQDEGRSMAGTVDTWVLWNLTGGRGRGCYVTDVTNASRTLLMDLKTASWDPTACSMFGVRADLLPKICSSSEVYGVVADGPLEGVPLAGCLGDQQAALVGHHCLAQGAVKSTYGTGTFMLLNTAEEAVQSSSGLLTTAGYQLGPEAQRVYALEGSVAVAGEAVKWLRDSLRVIEAASQTAEIARSVPDCGGVYFVPAFSGLFAPYWRSDARGLIVGISGGTSRAHIVRATLEAVCFQTRELLDAMRADTKKAIPALVVDGGMTVNEVFLQLLADICGVPVERPVGTVESTALGAAFAAGRVSGMWESEEEFVAMTSAQTVTYEPKTTDEARNQQFARWKRAVHRSMGWLSSGDDPSETTMQLLVDLEAEQGRLQEKLISVEAALGDERGARERSEHASDLLRQQLERSARELADLERGHGSLRDDADSLRRRVGEAESEAAARSAEARHVREELREAIAMSQRTKEWYQECQAYILESEAREAQRDADDEQMRAKEADTRDELERAIAEAEARLKTMSVVTVGAVVTAALACGYVAAEWLRKV